MMRDSKAIQSKTRSRAETLHASVPARNPIGRQSCRDDHAVRRSHRRACLQHLRKGRMATRKRA